MPKKRKNRNNSRSTRSAGTRERSQRDEVTGLHLSHNGEKIYSDSIYDQINSPQGQALFGSLLGSERVFADGGSALFEIEAGGDAIIINIHTVGEISVDGVPQSSNNYRKRLTYSGDFRYSREGQFIGGAVREIADWSYGTLWADGGVYEWGSIDKSQADIKVDDPAGLWTAATRIMQNTRVFDYLADYGDGLVEGDARETFYNFPVSRFYEGSWWDNPFATNLI
jgi:hypothetical protein